MNAISIQNINKHFYDPVEFQVLKNISFDVKKGEFVSIVGKSGSGKSTLLYLLSTMDTNYKGNIAINGTQVTGLSQNELAKFRNEQIGFVFQFHFLLPEFTVLDNVMLPALKLNKRTKDEIEAEAIASLHLLGLKGNEYKKASKISGGQQQRVAIARALINSPSIIMGDEPTGNLDSKNSDRIIELILELHRVKQATIILVTHEYHVAERSERILTLADGQIISDQENP